jgi:hypothetical protein
MVQLLPELFPHIAKYCDLLTCISLASCDKTVRKEITCPSGLKTINTLKFFPEIESWQEFILKHNLEIMNDKCYLYHPIANCFEYALANNNKELVNFLKVLIPDRRTDLQIIMNHAVTYKNHDLIDCLILKSKICGLNKLDIHTNFQLDVLKYLMEHHNFNPKRQNFAPIDKDVCFYLYENKLLYLGKYWPKICYQDTKLFERLLNDGIGQRNISKHLDMLLSNGTLESLVLFIKKYPFEYNNYAKKDARIQSLHNHELFKFIINDHNIELLTISPEIIRDLYNNALEKATLETISYLFPSLTHTAESLGDDLIFALDCSRTDVCDFIFDKLNRLYPGQVNLTHYISTSDYWGDLGINLTLELNSLIWAHNNMPGSIKWQEVLLYNDSLCDIYNHQHMALLYFILEYLYKHRIRINENCKFFERNKQSYIYRHHIKLYKALRTTERPI